MIKNLFLRYVIPSMLAFAFTGVYSLVDGFFVGRNVGDAGLASINLAYPIQAFIQATGSGIGMAGAVNMAISRGKKDKKKEQTYQGTTLILLLLAACILTIFISTSYDSLLLLFGAQGDVYSYAKDYMKVISYGTLFQILSVGLIPLIRNSGSAIASMFIMSTGFILNIILDYVFVSKLEMEVFGAALATVLGQVATCIVAIIYLTNKVKLFKSSDFKLTSTYINKVLMTAISPFGLSLTPNVVIAVVNKGASTYGGSQAVATYAVISYVICVVQLLVQGIGDGVQPLIGRYYGAKDMPTVRSLRKMSFIASYLTTLAYITLVYVFFEELPRFFGVSQDTLIQYKEVLPYFTLSLLLQSFIRIVTSYFYATMEHFSAYALIYGEIIIVTLLILFVLPQSLGLKGVWLAIPITQLCLSVGANVMYNKKILQQLNKLICL